MRRALLLTLGGFLLTSTAFAGRDGSAWYDSTREKLFVEVNNTALLPGEQQTIKIEVVYYIYPDTGSTFGATVNTHTVRKEDTVKVDYGCSWTTWFDPPSTPSWGYDSYTVKWEAYIPTWHGGVKLGSGQFSIWDSQ